MSIKHVEEYRDSALSKGLIEKIKRASTKEIRLMEVCGTHTVSIFRSGVRSVLPETISLLSGPGCPVCVTAQHEIDAFIELARMDDVIIATFGDLIRVPGKDSSLRQERSEGRDIRIVYSTFDAVEIARNNPDKKVIFLGVGFETTAPTVAAAILSALAVNLTNFFVYSAHKMVPPALSALMEIPGVRIDGFILPGHVSTIIGTEGYRDFVDSYKLPCVAAGFEPIDILKGVLALVEGIEAGGHELSNAYERGVSPGGNKKAMALIEQVFEVKDTVWRGIGNIPGSGLFIREAFGAFDAARAFDLELSETENPKGCSCGEILSGLKIPPQCALYKKVCTPMNPVGPCMVSTEGTCAAYYRYYDK